MLRKCASLAVVAVWAMLSLSGCGGSSTSVSVTATPATVDGTDTVALTATVTNDSANAGVTWTLSGAGSLSNKTATTAVYTAPAATSAAQTVTVTATSVKDASKTGTATITVAAAPKITTTSANLNSVVGAAYSQQLAGSGGITPYTWTLSSGQLPGCLTMTSGGLISGTVVASCAGAYTPTFTLTDSGSPNKLTATQEIDITIAAAPAITFTGAMPATGLYNQSYTGSAAATGGAGTLTYTLSAGALPGGLSLNAASGAVMGTPTAVGTFNFTIQAADAFGDAQTHAYQIVVSYPQLSITTAAALPGGYANGNYSQQLAAAGGSGTGYAWSVTSGSTLPTGLTLSTGGLLHGTPATPNTYTFSVTVTDSAQNTANLTFTLVVHAGVTITTAAALPVGYANGSYSQQLAATGGSGTGYAWSVTSGSTLPAGLTLSQGGLLSGTPTTQNTYTFNITVTDSVQNTANQTFSLTVNAGVSITSSATLPNGYQNSPYAGATLTATGGTNTGFKWTWAADTGSSLPAGLVLSQGGLISGTPTTAGTFHVVITATDSANNTATQHATLAVEAALSITSPATLPGGTKNVLYTQTLTATGGSGTYTNWQVTADNGPQTLATLGLSLSTAGVLTGTPAVTGTDSFTVQVTDSESHTATANLSVTIYSTLTITTTTLPATDAGVAYSQTLTAGGGTGSYTWATTGASNLSSFNLTLSSAGVLSGTPSTAGTASFTAQVTDSSSHTATQALTVTVYAALTLTAPSSSVPGPGTKGVAYTGAVPASGGSGNYSWTVNWTNDPSGDLSASSTGNPLSISGMPNTVATYQFTASVKDTTTNQSVGPNTYNIVVSNPAPLTLPSPNPSPLPSATQGQSYSGGINATGGISPYTWKINNATVTATGIDLGNGFTATNNGGNTLSVNATTANATGSTYTVTLNNVTVTDGSSTTAGPYTYSIAVNPMSTLAVTVDPNSIPQGMVGMPYNFGNLNITGGTAPYSVVSYTNAPTGLSLLSGTMNLAGTPTATASATTVTVKVQDSTTPTPQTATTTFNVSVVAKTTGTNNSELSGQYACYFMRYWDNGVTGPNGMLYRGGSVFAFAANGSGGITGGEIDSNSPASGYKSASANGALSGTYAVGSDNRGYLQLSAANQSGAAIFAIAGGKLDSNSHFTELALVGMDDAGTTPSGKYGGGRCYQQVTAGLSGSQPSGGMVWSLRGEDSAGALDSQVGYSQFSGGTLSSGSIDMVDAGAYQGPIAITGTNTTADSYGRMTITAGPTGQTANPSVWYMTNNTKGYSVGMTANPHNASSNADFLIGESRAQVAAHVSASYPISGKLVLSVGGLDSDLTTWKTEAVQAVGSSTANSFTINADIRNKGGTIQTTCPSGSACPTTITYTTNATTGRTTLTGVSGIVFYLYDTSSAAVLFGDVGNTGGNSENELGWLEPQTAPSSGTWAISNLATKYFMSKLADGDYTTDLSNMIFTLGSTGSMSGFAQDDGGQGWADWDEALCGSPGCSGTTANVVPDTTANGTTGALGTDPNGLFGVFDVQGTQGGMTQSMAYCFAISVDAATNSSTKGRLVCMDASSQHPSLMVIQE